MSLNSRLGCDQEEEKGEEKKHGARSVSRNVIFETRTRGCRCRCLAGIALCLPSPAAAGTQQCFHLTQSIFKAVLQMSIPTQNRRLVLSISYSKESVNGFVGESTSAKRL